jgi:hypothetical protein
MLLKENFIHENIDVYTYLALLPLPTVKFTPSQLISCPTFSVEVGFLTPDSTSFWVTTSSYSLDIMQSEQMKPVKSSKGKPEC